MFPSLCGVLSFFFNTTSLSGVVQSSYISVYIWYVDLCGHCSGSDFAVGAVIPPLNVVWCWKKKTGKSRGILLVECQSRNCALCFYVFGGKGGEGSRGGRWLSELLPFPPPTQTRRLLPALSASSLCLTSPSSSQA